MKPGNELNILIAERVFKCKVELTLNGPVFRHKRKLLRVPRFSEDFAAGFEVASWIARQTGEFFCNREENGQYICLYDYDENDEGLTVMGQSAPHATCLAALKVVEMIAEKARLAYP